MRPSILASTITALLLVTAFASAADPTSKKKKATKKPATTEVAFVVAPNANVEALPPLPPSPPAPAAPTTTPAPAVAKDAPAEAPKDAPNAGTGFVMSFGSGIGVMTGKIGGDLDIGGGFMTFNLKVGAYVTPRVGFVVGFEGGYGGLFNGCSGTCKAYTYQLPLLVQYTLQDRSRGPYVEGGLALFSTYGGSTDPSDNGDAPESLQVSSPFDFKLGMGFRIPVGVASTFKAPPSSLDIHAGMDLGQFKKVDYSAFDTHVKGDIPSEKQALHATFGISVGYQFAP